MILIVLLSSVAFSLCAPSLNSLYIKFVQLNPQHESDILGISDFFSNLAYIIGPVTAGFLAQIFGFTSIFSVYSLVGVIVVMSFVIKKGSLFFNNLN